MSFDSHILILGSDDTLSTTIRNSVSAAVSVVTGFEELLESLEESAKENGNVDCLILDCRYLKGDLQRVVAAIKQCKHCQNLTVVGVFNSRSESAGANYLDFRIEAGRLAEELPAALKREHASQNSEALENKDEKETREILVVEDNAINQKIAKMMLKSLGYRCEVVNNGKEACEILEKRRFDMVLMDCQMPIMDGFEATNTIRNNTTVAEDLPIIAFTANVTDINRQRCFDSGMDGFLTKPINRSKLVSVVEKWFCAGVN